MFSGMMIVRINFLSGCLNF